MDVQVLGFEALLRIEHQNTDVGLLDGADRAHHGVEFEVFGHLAFFAHAGRIDQVEIESVLVVARVNGVARGAGDRRDDVAFFAQQGVGERRLAHVRTAYDGDAGQLFFLVLGFRGQVAHDFVHQVARAAAAHRADAVGFSQSQRIKFVRGVDQVVVIDLVADQQHFFRSAPQDVGHHLIEIRDARIDFDQEQDDVRLFDGEHHLTADVVFENVVRIDRIAAGVDHRKFTSVPVGFTVMAVACRACRRIDDGFALSDQAVEQCAFAHVRASYDRYKTHNVILRLCLCETNYAVRAERETEFIRTSMDAAGLKQGQR